VKVGAFAFVGMLLLSGCAMLRDNVKGSFACQTPQGTCAPSSIIDDAALQAIASEDAGPTSGGLIRDRAHAEVPTGPSSKGRRTARMQPAPPPQTSRVLRIVFPAHVDRYGRLHETAAVQVPLSDPELMPTLAERDGRAPTSSTRDLLGLAADAPEFGLGEAAPPAPAISSAISPQAAVVTKPGMSAPSPVDAIKAEVAAVLAPARKAPDLPVATVQAP
jgi:conjugal transfer pilus assembly protein TraV